MREDNRTLDTVQHDQWSLFLAAIIVPVGGLWAEKHMPASAARAKMQLYACISCLPRMDPSPPPSPLSLSRLLQGGTQQAHMLYVTWICTKYHAVLGAAPCLRLATATGTHTRRTPAQGPAGPGLRLACSPHWSPRRGRPWFVARNNLNSACVSDAQASGGLGMECAVPHMHFLCVMLYGIDNVSPGLAWGLASTSGSTSTS